MTALLSILAASFGLIWGGRMLARRGPGPARFAFLLSRLGQGLLTLLAVFTLSFFLMHAVPGGPFDLERSLDPTTRARLEAHYRLDLPLFEQYLQSLAAVSKLDLGPSMKLRDFSVKEVIQAGLPVSFVLGIAALFWMLLLGLPAGALAALHRGSWLDRLLQTGASLCMALPNFVVAGLLMIPLVFTAKLLPAAGIGSIRHLILPSFCLGLPFAARLARLLRTSLLEVLEQDWIRTARAKGAGKLRLLLVHAAPAALVPVVTWLGPALAGLLTGSLVIEELFAIPGLGTHFVERALNRDYPLALGMVLLYTSLLYLLNMGSDLLVALLDPRVHLE